MSKHPGDENDKMTHQESREAMKARYNVASVVADDDDLPDEANPDVIGDERDRDGEGSSSESDESPIILPTGLQMRVMKQYLMAIAVTILTIVLVIVYKTPQCLAGFVVAGTLVYMAITTKYDYRDGKIKELCLLCSSITPMKVRNSARLIFRSQDDIPLYYEFILPGKKHSEFMLNQVYVVYFKEDDPKNLLGHTPL